MIRIPSFGRNLVLASGVALLAVIWLVKLAAGQADGTPDPTTQGLPIDPVSLVLGIAAGAAGAGIPLAVRSRRCGHHGSDGSRVDPVETHLKLEEVEDEAVEKLGGPFGGTVGSGAVGSARQVDTYIKIGDIKGDKDLGPGTGGGAGSPSEKTASIDGKKHTKTGHVTLLK